MGKDRQANSPQLVMLQSKGGWEVKGGGERQASTLTTVGDVAVAHRASTLTTVMALQSPHKQAHSPQFHTQTHSPQLMILQSPIEQTHSLQLMALQQPHIYSHSPQFPLHIHHS